MTSDSKLSSSAQHASGSPPSEGGAGGVARFGLYSTLFLLTTLTLPASAQQPNSGRALPNRAEFNDDLNPPRAANRPAAAPANLPPLPPAPPALDVDQMLAPEGLSSTVRLMLLFTVLSLAPAILMMTTCFIRFVIVLGLLRQALGTQQLPPNQVIVSLCMFLTYFVMSPVWEKAYDDGIRPYTNNQPIAGAQPGEDRFSAAIRNTLRPLRQFMSDQIERTGNTDGVWMLLELRQPAARDGEAIPETYDELPLSVLLPAYMLSELKTAFVIGFQIYLPFLVIDMVVSSVLTSMGMMMMPPLIISNPLKLVLFVLIDGWSLTVGMLLESVKLVSS